MSHDESERRKPKRKPAADRGLFQRPAGSGIWWVCYFDENGRKHREKIGPKALARKVYQMRKTTIQQRRFFPERIRRRDVLVRDYLTQYLTEHVEGRLRNATHYRRYADLWRSSLGTKALREVIPGDISRHIARRGKDGMSPATINRELSFLKRAYNVAIEDGMAEKNPVCAVRMLKEDNARVRCLTADEETGLRTALPDDHWPKVAVALHTGMRRANVFSLRWSDVNFEAGVVTARRTKSGETYHVPVNDELLAILRSLPSRLRSPWVCSRARPARRLWTPRTSSTGPSCRPSSVRASRIFTGMICATPSQAAWRWLAWISGPSRTSWGTRPSP